MKNQIPIWRQWGFTSEKAFRERYPHYGRTQKQKKSQTQGKGKRKAK